MPPLSCSAVVLADTVVYGKSASKEERYSFSLPEFVSLSCLFSHLSVFALQFWPASDIAIASGSYLVTRS